MTAFLARIGDRINPIVVKESRQAVNSRLVAGFLLLFLAVQLVVMLLMIISRDSSTKRPCRRYHAATPMTVKPVVR